MEYMSIFEFSKYCENKKPKVVIYNDENNRDYAGGYKGQPAICNPLRICLAFDDIRVHPFMPTCICLKGDCGAIRFDYVEKIGISEKDSVLGDVVVIYCSNSKCKRAYTVIIK